MTDDPQPRPEEQPDDGIEAVSFFNRQAPSGKGGGIENAPWVTSFIDTISLLLTFFVLLFSMSTLDKSIWQEVVDTFDSYFKQVDAAGNIGKPISEAVPKIMRQRAINLDYLGRIIETQMQERELGNILIVQKLDDRLVISVPSDFLFNPGQAELTTESRELIVSLGSILRNVRNKVEIYGHTDPTPVRGGIYPSNWELSIARALTLKDRLKQLGLRRNITAIGYADAKFSELAPDLPQDQKFSLSRRVDIVIYPHVS